MSQVLGVLRFGLGFESAYMTRFFSSNIQFQI